MYTKHALYNTLQNFNAEIDNVVGSVFVAAASVAYYGAFTSDYRAEVSLCACANVLYATLRHVYKSNSGVGTLLLYCYCICVIHYVGGVYVSTYALNLLFPLFPAAGESVGDTVQRAGHTHIRQRQCGEHLGRSV